MKILKHLGNGGSSGDGQRLVMIRYQQLPSSRWGGARRAYATGQSSFPSECSGGAGFGLPGSGISESGVDPIKGFPNINAIGFEKIGCEASGNLIGSGR